MRRAVSGSRSRRQRDLPKGRRLTPWDTLKGAQVVVQRIQFRLTLTAAMRKVLERVEVAPLEAQRFTGRMPVDASSRSKSIG